MSDAVNNPAPTPILQDRSRPGGLRPEGSAEHLLLRIENLGKRYPLAGGRSLNLFSGLTFSVFAGEIVAIVGPSGAGKSSLLHMLGALDQPSAGEVWVDGIAVSGLAGAAAARFRNREVGYVWQFHYLLPEFTALENVAMPLLARGERLNAAERQAADWLGRVGLADRAKHQAGELSGGEQQRVSLARALITRPKLLLADEPTGDLDGVTADAVFGLIEELHRVENLTTVLVTHNMPLARRCHRVLRLTHGGIAAFDGPEAAATVE
jgi:lipoprotein-releasing system ATP-binding protein